MPPTRLGVIFAKRMYVPSSGIFFYYYKIYSRSIDPDYVTKHLDWEVLRGIDAYKRLTQSKKTLFELAYEHKQLFFENKVFRHVIPCNHIIYEATKQPTSFKFSKRTPFLKEWTRALIPGGEIHVEIGKDRTHVVKSLNKFKWMRRMDVGRAYYHYERLPDKEEVTLFWGMQ